MPDVSLPNRERVYLPVKNLYLPFVQFDVRETPFLWGARRHESHSTLFRRVLEAFDIPYENVKGIPAASGEGYQLIGAGIGMLHDNFFSVQHNGRSKEYGMGTDWSHINLISQFAPGITFGMVRGGEECDADEGDDGR